MFGGHHTEPAPGASSHGEVGVRGRVALVLAVILCLVGAGLIGSRGVGLRSTSAAAGAAPADREHTRAPENLVAQKRAAQPFSPSRIRIPEIGVDAPVIPVGLKADRSLVVPDPAKAGWWDKGARAG